MKIKLGFFSILIVLCLLVSDLRFALCSFVAIVLHELAHVFFAKVCGVGFQRFEFGIYGARLYANNNVFSYWKEVVISLAGPLINIISTVIVYPIYANSRSETIFLFMSASVTLGILNLLPIRSFDGGRAIYALLSMLLPIHVAEKILYAFSSICIFILWTLSVYLLITSKAGLSTFVFSISLFSKIIDDK